MPTCYCTCGMDLHVIKTILSEVQNNLSLNTSGIRHGFISFANIPKKVPLLEHYN